MAKVVIKTQSGMYVGGDRQTQLVDRVTRAYLYEDGPEVDSQLSIVNTTYGWNWQKADAEVELQRVRCSAAGRTEAGNG
jgi:hypothetical protein